MSVYIFILVIENDDEITEEVDTAPPPQETLPDLGREPEVLYADSLTALPDIPLCDLDDFIAEWRELQHESRWADPRRFRELRRHGQGRDGGMSRHRNYARRLMR